jgi:alkylhydroperoxidase family enzyme
MPSDVGAPRIPPLRDDEVDEQARELLAGVAGGPAASNIFTTLVRHPGLFRRWTPFGGKLLAGKLPPRDRELLILRTGYRCGSEYEWGQHVLIGRAAGVTDDELPRIQAGPEAEGWSARDALLMRVADELHDDSCITDATWAALTDHYDERQLIEIPMLVGHYHMVAFTLRSLGVQREPGVPGFDG